MTRVVGLISGTSVDAIDVAVVDLDVDDAGDEFVLTRIGETSVALPGGLRARVLDTLPPASTTTEAICRLDTELGQAFAGAALQAIETLGAGDAELVVSHGQTLHHDVVDGRVAGTLQLGQPAWVAEAAGLPVGAHLRARDVAAGGQGAPLVAHLDELVLADRATAPVAACNLGGIANLTVVTPDAPTVAFDCGPANALLDVAVRRAGAGEADRGGVLAAAGRIDAALREVLLADPYLAADWPKSTGKERYHAGYLEECLARAPLDSLPDLLATLTDAAATGVADHVARAGVTRVWASGGGVHNTALIDRLEERLEEVGASLATSDELGLPVDAKEAIAIALLGWCSWVGAPATVPSATGARGPRVVGAPTPGAGPLSGSSPRRVETPSRLRIVAPGTAGQGARPETGMGGTTIEEVRG